VGGGNRLQPSGQGGDGNSSNCGDGRVDLWMSHVLMAYGPYLFIMTGDLAETSPVGGWVGRQWACVMA
jgi:hypothetical protein